MAAISSAAWSNRAASVARLTRLTPKAPCRNQDAFAQVAGDTARQDGGAGGQRRRDVVEHRPHDGRNAGHDEHIADLEAGGGGDRVVDERGALGHARHAQPPRRHLARAVMRLQQRDDGLVQNHGQAKRFGDRIRGDVVMSRADPAGGEDIAVAGGQRPHRVDDLRFDVAHHPRLGQPDAERGQLHRDMVQIHVLGAAREDFVADDQDGG